MTAPAPHAPAPRPASAPAPTATPAGTPHAASTPSPAPAAGAPTSPPAPTATPLAVPKRRPASGPREVAVVDRPEDLARALAPGLAAAILWRTPPAGLLAAIAAWPADRLPRLRRTLAAEDAAAALAAACAEAGTPEGPARDALVAESAALARLAARLMAAPRLGLRLDVVRDDACRRFHLDRVRARLLCTWRGRGTQYGEAPAGGGDPDPVFEVPTGAPAVFRGSLAPGGAPRLLHRSPPIEGTGETRLLLVVDPAAPDDDDDHAPGPA